MKLPGGSNLKKINKKRILDVVIVALFLTTVLFPCMQGGISDFLSLMPKNDCDVTITVLTNDDETGLTFNLNGYHVEKVSIDNKKYVRIVIDGESNIKKNGSPDLPIICRSIIVPDNAKMDAKIANSEYEEFDNILIAPSKGSFFRNTNPRDIPYEFGKVYTKDGWFPGDLVELREPYILRDFRGQVVKINPFQYNPVKKTLRVYNEITLNVSPVGPGEINVFERTRPLVTVDSAFNSVYGHHFINYDKRNVISDNGDPMVEEQGEMLVICYDDFYSAMTPFVDWKNMKGIPTVMVNLSDVGSSASDIDTYIKNYYFAHSLTFVLLVGDVQQIPTKYVSIPPCPECYASDPSYSYVKGNDHYPDVFVGRFSAQTVDQLQTQIERTIIYEKYPKPGDWFHKGVGVASNDGPYDDGEYDWEHIRNIRMKLLNYTFIEVDELYDGSHGGEDAFGDPTPRMISSMLNDGCSIVNYCGDGCHTSWDTSGFCISDVDNLVNENMLPLVITVACDTGQFDKYDTCFCEAWMRAIHDGKPTGAIAATGSSKDMTFYESMAAQDAMMDVLCGGIHTIGMIHVCGCLDMMCKYQTDWANYETDCWHIFGDPSVKILVSFPPDVPNCPTGPASGKLGEKYTYSTSTIEPDGSEIYYQWEWDDGAISKWLGPYNSDELCEASHIWENKGDYNIRVKAKDNFGVESDWSDPLPVSMSKNKLSTKPAFVDIKENNGMWMFLTRSIETVKTEFNLVCAESNLKKIWIELQKKNNKMNDIIRSFVQHPINSSNIFRPLTSSNCLTACFKVESLNRNHHCDQIV